MEGSRPPRKIKLGMEGPTTTPQPQLQDLSDDILEHILLRLGSCLWLIRAAAVCKRWRAVAADAGFLARFRHVPLLLGHYHSVDNEYDGYEEWTGAGGAVFVPYCSPSVVDRLHLSLEFLPDSESWEVVDSRGGLLLLSKKRAGEGAIWHSGFPDMMVCEPLTKRCQTIVSPADLEKHDRIAMFLLDGDGGGIHMSNFRIVAAVHVPLVSVFSSSSGEWHLARNDILVPAGIRGGYENFLGRAHGRLYLARGQDKDVFVLDETTAEFSLVSYPDNTWGSGGGCDRWTHRMVGREDGAVRAVRVTRDNDLKVFVQEPGSGEWMLEKLLSLPEATRGLPGRQDYFFGGRADIVAANKRHILITPYGTTWLFTVDLDAMQADNQHERNKFPGEAYPYELPWPPSLQACRTILHN